MLNYLKLMCSLIALVVLTSGCSPSESSSKAEEDVLVTEENLPTLSLTILDHGKVEQIKMDSTDNPDYYAINGTLVARNDALKNIKAGEMACAVRYNAFVVTNGEVLEVNSIKTGLESSILHWANMASTPLSGFGGFAMLCMQKDKAITLQGARAAVRGMIQVK